MNLNTVILIGNLVRDVELKYTQSGVAVANISIAVNDYKKEDVDFIDCTLWEKTAEIAAEYLRKGNKVRITGRLKKDSYNKQDGTKAYKTYVKVDSFNGMEFLNSKDDTTTAPAQGGYAPKPQATTPAQGGYTPKPQATTPAQGGYAPQQQAAAPTQGGYAPQQQQQAAAPTQGGYAPQQQQQAAAPTQGGYAPQPQVATNVVDEDFPF